ncbi:hypothetical protein BD830_105113 [Maritimibacter alkaliphilus HTCC2654]|uniref:DUF192 domain-containing protein n=1 Tax=Maritimibacter alkaliphilus TaxID=404236 RepID=UPI000321F69E|nr:hypothetical protein BD830_105113 [Maritimibacter alkaliphilus HTCC2654]
MKVTSVLLAACLAGPLTAQTCDEAQVDLRGTFGTARFSVEIADDDAERAQGLMFRESLPSGQGMLFIYESPRPASFWMKNTLIPLDMIFVGADGVVRNVHENAVPGDLTPIRGGDDILAVLEIRGGLAGAIGIEAGAEMRHPAFGDAAAWSCAAQ